MLRTRRSRTRTVLVAVAALLAVAASAATAAVGRVTAPLDDDRYVLLVMGSDQGPWRSGDVLGGRADAMHLVTVVPSERSASILSFPRDTYVPVAGFGTTRINASLTRGPATAVATVEQLVGVEVDDWIVTGMRAFHTGVTDFGGVEIDVPQRLQIDDNVLRPGVQRLDGPDALLYGRDRKNRRDGDFGRNRAQAEVLAALHAELVGRSPSPTELLDHVRTLRRTTVSSIPTSRLVVLASLAMQIDPANVTRAQVPGRPVMRGGASVVQMGGSAEDIFADLREDGLLRP